MNGNDESINCDGTATTHYFLPSNNIDDETIKRQERMFTRPLMLLVILCIFLLTIVGVLISALILALTQNSAVNLCLSKHCISTGKLTDLNDNFHFQHQQYCLQLIQKLIRAIISINLHVDSG
jgi:hypothetical protein